MTDDQTRYQILYTHSSTIENYPASQQLAFRRRCQELRKAGVAFTTWDTRRNSLAELLGAPFRQGRQYER